MACEMSHFIISSLLRVVSGEEVSVELVLGRDIVLNADFDLLLNRDASGQELSSSLREKKMFQPHL